MRRIAHLAILTTAVVSLLGAPAVGLAQEQQEEEEGPGTRIVTATIFQVPFAERSKVFPFMREYFLPGIQLNPNVLNFRLLVHNWGSDASQVVLLSEYASLADIEAECGQPCEDYQAAHPEPEEGTPEREEFEERQAAFSKYYTRHRDEIYLANMEVAKVEGELMGPVGPPPEAEEEGGN